MAKKPIIIVAGGPKISHGDKKAMGRDTLIHPYFHNPSNHSDTDFRQEAMELAKTGYTPKGRRRIVRH